MEKYYADYDGTFICDDFVCEFKDKIGNNHKCIVNGVVAYAASFWVNKQTGQPIYCENDDTKTHEDWFSSFRRPFKMTIDAECGVILIPKIDVMQLYMEHKPDGVDDNYEIGFKITSYGVQYKDSPESIMCEVCFVDESEFKRIIKENFEKFN